MGKAIPAAVATYFCKNYLFQLPL